MSQANAVGNSTTLEEDARLVTARDGHIAPGDIAIGVVIGRTSEFFDFFVYAIASVLVFPSLVFPEAEPLQGTIYSFALFALAFIARPFGSLLFMEVDRRHGKGVKLTIALFLLGGSTMAIAFLPGQAQIGAASAILLGLFRIGQGLAWGGVWDGLPSLLSLNAPENKRGWYAMVPQLGAPIGLLVAAGLFAFFLWTLSPSDFLSWGWRYPFFVAFAINAVALFARLRLVATPEFEHLYQTRTLQPSPARDVMREEWRTVVLGAFAPLASFAMFHLVTVFPLSWAVLVGNESAERFLTIEMIGAGVGLVATAASGMIADRIGRRNLLGISAVLIGIYSWFAPQLLSHGENGELAYMVVGFLLLGLGFGQSSGAINAVFSARNRYTGAALTSDFAWLIGAGFAPLAVLLLSTRFGLGGVTIYLMSGAVCTVVALFINRELGRRSG